MSRVVTLKRTTKETDIQLTLNLDGKGTSSLETGVGFFDHMLTHIAKHGFFDLDVTCKGDCHIDDHHTIEDIGIVFGQALKKTMDDKVGMKRYGSAVIPMDETLILCAVDCSGRPFLNFDVDFTAEHLGTMATEMVEEFFRAVSVHGGMNIHIKQLAGKNNHHIAEGIFKAFANALDQATLLDPRLTESRSTKGLLE